MKAAAILIEMERLLEQQVEHLIAGDHQALAKGSGVHEHLLAALQKAEIDAPPAEIRRLAERVETVKQKLNSLLKSESQRVDFMLRLLLGKGTARPSGYPGQSFRAEGNTGRLNQRA